MTDAVTTTEGQVPTKYQWRANKKQLDFMERWLSPTSLTYANVMQSAIAAGYSKSYAEKILTFDNLWISEYMKRVGMTPGHIKMGVQEIAQDAPNSKSPDDTRLKAFEILGKMEGMIDTKNGPVTVNVVQPILGGTTQQTAANTPTKVEAKVTVKQTEDKEEQTLADKLID